MREKFGKKTEDSRRFFEIISSHRDMKIQRKFHRNKSAPGMYIYFFPRCVETFFETIWNLDSSE